MLAVCTSCVQKRFLHQAAPAINPVLKEKGDAFATGYYHTNGATRSDGNVDVSNSSSNGIHLQGGYAVSNHVAVLGSYNNIRQRNQYNDSYSDPFDSSNVLYKRNEFTVAGDYYLTADDQKSVFHVIGGFTFGKLSFTDNGKDAGSNYSRFFKSNSFMAFVQPTFTLYSFEHTGFTIYPKVSYVQYGSVNTNYTDQEKTRLRLIDAKGFYTSEIGGKVFFGLDEFPLLVDVQSNYIIMHSARIHVRRFDFAVGLTYLFQKRKKAK